MEYWIFASDMHLLFASHHNVEHYDALQTEFALVAHRTKTTNMKRSFRLVVTIPFLITRKCSSFEVSKSLLGNSDHKCYIVSTASRGIGLEFTNQLVHRTSPTAVVIGLFRSKSQPLEELAIRNPKLKLVHVNLESQESVASACNEIRQLTSKVDMLFNVAAILGDGKREPGPERSLENINREWLEKSMQVNLFGHIMMTQGLLPLLKRPMSPSASDDISHIVNLSARVGSISDNSLGGWYSYRMSKAALNMFTKTSSVELKRYKCAVISIHPGTTNTDLSLPFQKNVKPEKLFPVDYSVSSMLDVIWRTKLADTGKFYAYDGTEIPY